MERYDGAFKSHRPAGNLAKVETLEQTIEMVSAGLKTAELFGMLKAQREKVLGGWMILIWS